MNNFVKILSEEAQSTNLGTLPEEDATDLSTVFSRKLLGEHCSLDWYKKSGALRHARSFFIRNLNFDSTVNSCQLSNLPEFQTILLSLFNKDYQWLDSSLKRAYYTEIPANSVVYPHIDNNEYFRSIVRFQIYLSNSEPLCKVIEEDTLVQYSFGQVRTFNLTRTHSVTNDSNHPLKLVVFDIQKLGI